MDLVQRIIHKMPALKERDTYNNSGKCDVLLICHDVDRGDLKNGLPYSKLIDSIHEEFSELNIKCIQFALPYSKYLGKNAWGSPFSGNRLHFFLKATFFIPHKVFGIFNLKTFGENYFETFFYNSLLKRTCPRFIIAIGASSMLCKVSRFKSIPVMELLHAIGYDSIRWGWENKKQKFLPTHILSLDRISSNSFSPLKEKGVKIIEIPHPWYKRFLGKTKDLNSMKEWLKPPSFIPSGKKVILVSLTCGYDGDHGEYIQYENILQNGLVPDELIEAIEATQQDVFWCLRRHPVQIMSKNLNKQLNYLNEWVTRFGNCEWVGSTNSALIALLGRIDGHMSMSSTTVYDAALLGVKSLLFCPTLKPGAINGNWFSDLRKSGHVTWCEPNTNFFIDWVRTIEKDVPVSLSNSTQFEWETFIKDLMEKK